MQQLEVATVASLTRAETSVLALMGTGNLVAEFLASTVAGSPGCQCQSALQLGQLEAQIQLPLAPRSHAGCFRMIQFRVEEVGLLGAGALGRGRHRSFTLVAQDTDVILKAYLAMTLQTNRV
jgi:hypothetical protein